jgi:pyrroline-5-carboxylate reductase
MRKTIGFIGCGNMGRSILNGILKCKLVRAKNIRVFDTDLKKTAELQKTFGIRKAFSLDDLICNSDIVLLAVKPQHVKDVAKALKFDFKKSHIVVSILAGTPLTSLKKHFGARARFVRVMPNLGAVVGEGLFALCGDKSALPIVKTIFNACGETIKISEKFFDHITALSGSGPAYFFLLMELIEKEAVRAGIQRTLARKLAFQTALGAACLAKGLNESPEELRKKVASKGGTTEAALHVLLKKRKFHQTFKEAVQAAVRRAKELSK